MFSPTGADAQLVQVAEAAEPELLAHHFAQAGMAEASIEWWGKAGQRSLERLVVAERARLLEQPVDERGLAAIDVGDSYAEFAP